MLRALLQGLVKQEIDRVVEEGQLELVGLIVLVIYMEERFDNK